jgi:hypothetical protein
MIWRAGEPESGASFMSQVGPLTLVFLLTEVEAAIQSPNHYLGGIFSGASFGAAFAIFGLLLTRKVEPKFHDWVGLGQVYLAYGFAFGAGASAVAAALVAVMVFIWLNQPYQLSYHPIAPSTPLNTWSGFAIILGLFLFLGWQAHQPLSQILIIEVLVGAMVGLFITVEAVVEVGIIEMVADAALQLTGGDVSLTSIFLIWFSAIASGIIDNIPYTATMIPLVKSLGQAMPTDPLWWSLALGACLGGNLTLVGAAANVVVANLVEKSGHPISFRHFFRYGVITTVLSLIFASGYVWLRYL